jgi:integrase
LRCLFAELPEGLCETLFMLALKTGLRQSELIGLRWEAVDLASGCIRVRHSFTEGATGTRKEHEHREVGLPTDLVVLLGGWRGECGRPGDAHLVFPGRGRGGHLAPSTLSRRMLYPAMRRADIPRRRLPGENRTFHSLRHTFAKRALESGRPLTWLSHHLGHSSVAVTSDVYGHWEAVDRRWEVRQTEGVFGV